jgi:hypothetical protein
MARPLVARRAGRTGSERHEANDEQEEGEATMERILETLKVVNHIVPASRSAGTTNGTGIDTSGHDEVAFVVPIGAIGDTGSDTTLNVKIQESDNDSDWSDISGAAITEIANTDDNAIPAINVRLGGRANIKKYVRAVAVVAGSDSLVYGVVAELKAQKAPVTNTPASVLVQRIRPTRRRRSR